MSAATETALGAVLHFERDTAAARALAAQLGVAAAPIDLHRFPDGELRLAFAQAPGESVAIYATLDDPNEKLVALMLAARTARELGTRALTLVAPYLCYMRQDIAFTPGQAVSQRIVGRFLAELFDAVVTVDPHLHRVASLNEAVPAKRALALSAAHLIGEFVR
ncbi:MAG: ribose-phosphate pyrophosphokinase-like domain-containing protein, partial [Burkholderiaceae bacterium]|nr:ribose-phosphate pyrophosphokinase-like domain-containing protein [Burkholderiaceae bacterium]